jgi:hypothetical protein
VAELSGRHYLLFVMGICFYPGKNLNVVNLPADITGSVVLLLASGFVVTTISLETEQPLFRNYKFVFNGTSFIYFCVNTFLSYIFILLIREPGKFGSHIWDIHSVINIAVNIIYAYGFSMKEKD